MTLVVKKYLWWVLTLSCAIFFLGGYYVGEAVGGPVVSLASPLREGGYRYIAPVLLCNSNPNLNYNNDAGLQSALQAFINTKPDDMISAYVLEMRTGGKWAGVNDAKAYAPASMLKVPTMAAILKYADTHADFLNKQIYYDGSFDDNRAEYFKPLKVIEPRRSYSIEQLLSYAVGYSDNNAERLLDGSIDRTTLESLYINLGVQLPPDVIDFMSARTYSLFLRVLYNSTYLSREMSEKALGFMSQPDFPQGLQSGVPSSVSVAQKFGERQIYSPDGQLQYRELHDCGIVYRPNDPYVLCVMTRGQEFASLVGDISGVSKIVYEYLEAHR